MPDGCFVSSEHLNTTAFNSLHETCDITDWSWAFGYMLMASGDVHWADRIEQMTFNALPGVLTKDFKQVQYFSSANQVLCSDTACTTFAITRMSYRAAHETECCAGNVKPRDAELCHPHVDADGRRIGGHAVRAERGQHKR